MSPRGIEVWRTIAERTRSAAFARHLGNAAALVVYFGPPTQGIPGSVRLRRAFVLRRRVRVALQSADTERRRRARRRELMKGALAVAALGAFALAFGQRPQAGPKSPSPSKAPPPGPAEHS